MRECVCVCIKITAGENTHVCGKQMQLEKKGEKKSERSSEIIATKRKLLFRKLYTLHELKLSYI